MSQHGLEGCFVRGSYKAIPAQYAARIERVLDRLDAAVVPEEMNLLCFKFHELKGRRKSVCSVILSGNWRMNIQFDGINAIQVDLGGLSLMKKAMRSLRNPNRRPTHPGAILREDVLPELGITQTILANHLGVSSLSVSEILHEKRGVSAEMAVRISKVIGGTPESWLHMQEAVDLWEVEQRFKRNPAIAPMAMKPLMAAA